MGYQPHQMPVVLHATPKFDPNNSPWPTVLPICSSISIRPKSKESLFLAGNCLLIASTVSVYSLRQILLRVLADCNTNSPGNALHERRSVRAGTQVSGCVRALIVIVGSLLHTWIWVRVYVGLRGKILDADLRLVTSRLYKMGVTRPWTRHIHPCHYITPS